jgi:hypothetical protein
MSQQIEDYKIVHAQNGSEKLFQEHQSLLYEKS